MHKSRIFVSFSHKDKDFVQRLFDRLRAQPVELWDYSREGQEIPGGHNVLRYLQERVERCDVFLPIVSPNSFTSNYARHEVMHAMKHHRAGRIRLIPLVSAHCPQDQQWPDPYEKLKGILSYQIEMVTSTAEGRIHGRMSLEEILRRLCHILDVEYSPLPLEDPRLPFMDKFDEELEQAKTMGHHFPDETRQIDIFGRLAKARNEVAEAIRVGGYGEALTAINYFIAICEYEVPEHSFFYPYIVKGICLVSSGQLLSALDVLLPMLQDHRCDENLFGLLGYIKQQQGAHREALEFYRLSMDKAPDDPAAKHGLILSAIYSGTKVDIDAWFRKIESTPITQPQDRRKVQALKAFAYATAGRLPEATRVYEEMLEEGLIDVNLLINYSHCLCDEGQTEHALALLAQYQGDYGLDDNYLHHLGTLYFRVGKLRHAHQCFECLITNYPRRRQYTIDAARVQWESGDRQSAKILARSILDRSQFGLPVSANDFFCDGFANWLLGNRERANYDFERSGLSSKNHYRHLIHE